MEGRAEASASTLFLCQLDALARKKFASGRRVIGLQASVLVLQLGILGFMVAYLSSEYPFVQMHRLRTVGSALNKLRVISVPKGREVFLSLDFDRLSQELHAVVLKVRLVIGALFPVAISLSPSLRLMLPLQERVSEAKQLQLMTGLSAARYWTITFLIDMVYHVLTTLLLLSPFFTPSRSDTVCETFTYLADCRNGSACATMDPLRSPWNVLSSGWDLLMMFLSGVLYLATAVSLETHVGLHQYMKHLPHQKHSIAPKLINVSPPHPSVTEEAELVKQLLAGQKAGDDQYHVTGLLVSELCLKTRAVGPLSFHVEQGEVFGIIALEQSGRSSLLAAIAGEEPFTKGSLHFNGASATANKVEYQRQIGYCPKNNPMITRLTSHEMLQLIARLRGLPSTQIDEEVSFIEGKVGLREVQNESVDNLRPCDQRKLSVGLALVGNPKLVILNECTRGVDPLSRGRLFRCMEKMHSCSNTSMIFTSHYLRECDAFCDRVAVLANGEFQVIGETSLMKEGCQQRFTVTVRLTKDSVQKGDYFKTVNRVMKTKFPSSLISDIRMDMLQYTVKDADIPWSDVFVRMEEIKDELDLDDYVLSEASLADVFLGFSHERKAVDFCGAGMRVYSDSDPCEVFTEVPETPAMLLQ